MKLLKLNKFELSSNNTTLYIVLVIKGLNKFNKLGSLAPEIVLLLSQKQNIPFVLSVLSQFRVSVIIRTLQNGRTRMDSPPSHYVCVQRSLS